MKIKLSLIVVIYSLIMALSPSLSFGYGSPDYLPDNSHPRIWLTSAELARLVGLRDNSDPSWKNLKSWCDAHINDYGYDVNPVDQSKNDLTRWMGNNNYSGYRMSGFASHLYNYSLAYQILMQKGTGQDSSTAVKYANRVKVLLIDGIYKALKSGEEDNGLKALRVGELHEGTLNSNEAIALGIGKTGYKNGFSSRFLMAVPVAYDWIHSTLTSSEKTQLTGMMLRWFDWVRGVRSIYNNGVLVNGIRYFEDQDGDCSGNNNCTSYSGTSTKAYDYGNIANNYGSGHEAMMSLIAVATYGDITSQTYIQSYKNQLEQYTLPSLKSKLKNAGGDSPEGWNYGGGYRYLVLGLYGYATATGDPNISSLQWISDLVRASAYRTSGDLLTVPLYGYWTGTPLGISRKNIILDFIGVEQKFRRSSAMSRLGQYLLNKVSYKDSVEALDNLLFYDSTISSQGPSALGLPLSYLATGNGFFATRSSWSDASASVFTVRLEGKITTSHEGYDEGHISLIRGSDRLLDHDNKNDAPPSVSFNTIVFNNTSHHASNPVQSVRSIDRIKEGVTYSYVSGDITNAYKRAYQLDKCKLFRRSVLHIRPDIYVVYDVTQSNTAIGNLKEWYTQYAAEPDIYGNTITVNKGDSRAYIQTVYPTGGQYTKTTPVSGFWRVKYAPATLNEYDQFLHVIEATSNTGTQTPTAYINATGGRGVKIGSKVVIFTDKSDGSNIMDVSYTSDATVHYIADLPILKGIAVLRNGSVISNITTDTSGIITFSTTGGQSNYEVKVRCPTDNQIIKKPTVKILY